MSEQENEGAGTGAETGQQAGAEQQPANQQEGQEDAEQLGDAGKKALDAMKTKWTGARDAEKATVAALAELHDRTPTEIRAAIKAGTLGELIGHKAAVRQGDQPDVAKLTAAARREAIAEANKVILAAELRAAAAGKLADPMDALALIDTSSIEVGEGGQVDRSELDDLIAALVSKKPYLAANATTTTFGKSDAGVRGGKAPTLDEQIATAEQAGNYTLARQLKSQKLAALNQ